MAFLEELRNRGVFSPAPVNDTPQYGRGRGDETANIANNMMPFINKIRNRDVFDRDYERQMNPVPEIPVQNGRLRQTMNPNASQQGMNVVFNDSNQMTPYQRGNLDLDKQRLQQQGQIGEERANLGRERLAFDQQKSNQIYETKNAEAETRARQAEERLAFSQRQLEANQGNQKAVLEFNQAKQEALDAKNALDATQRENNALETQRQNTERERQALLPQIQETTNFGEPDEDGNFPGRRVTTTRGEREQPLIPAWNATAARSGVIPGRMSAPNTPMPQSHEAFMAQNAPMNAPVQQQSQQPIQPQQQAANNAPAAPQGWRYVPKPGGGWTAVEAN